MFKNDQVILDLWQQLEESLFLLDKNGKIILWSRGCEKEFGWPILEVLNKDRWNFLFIDERELEKITAEMSPLLDDSYQVKWRDKNKKEWLVRLRLRALQLGVVKDCYFLARAENISQKNEVAKELQKVRLLAKEKSLAVERATELLKQKEKLLLTNMTEMKHLYEQVKRSEAALQEKTDELETKVKELNRFNRLMIGRETKMVELKKEIGQLRARLGE